MGAQKNNKKQEKNDSCKSPVDHRQQSHGRISKKDKLSVSKSRKMVWKSSVLRNLRNGVPDFRDLEGCVREKDAEATQIYGGCDVDEGPDCGFVMLKSVREKRLMEKKAKMAKNEARMKEDSRDECFAPLTMKEERGILRAFKDSNRTKVLATHVNSGTKITGKMLQCLMSGKWLHDDVIDVYLQLLKERELKEPQKFLKCHFFNTFFSKLKYHDSGREKDFAEESCSELGDSTQ